MANLDDIENRLVAAEQKVAEWEAFRKNRVSDPNFEIGLLVHLEQHDRRIAQLFDAIESLWKITKVLIDSRDTSFVEHEKFHEAYYKVFPDRLDKDLKFQEQCKNLFEAGVSATKPEKP